MNKRQLLALAAAAALALQLAGCGAMHAQNPGGTLRPVNAVPAESAERLMLKGADVVAYFTQGRYVQGQPAFASRYQDVDFHFASAEHKALFDKDPARYLPQFGGYCANGIVYGIPWGGDADTWTMIDGKLYIFGGRGSMDAFLLDPKTNVALAQKYWADEVQGSNSFVQRARRLTLRVPHYKSGEELARLVAQAKSAKP
jgi:YHS domain-containing protein